MNFRRAVKFENPLITVLFIQQKSISIFQKNGSRVCKGQMRDFSFQMRIIKFIIHKVKIITFPWIITKPDIIDTEFFMAGVLKKDH